MHLAEVALGRSAPDLMTWADEPRPRGRTCPRLPRGIYGRIDDQFTGHDENILPSAIAGVLLAAPGYGGEYRIIVSRTRAMDELVVQVEVVDAATHGNSDTLPRMEIRRGASSTINDL